MDPLIGASIVVAVLLLLLLLLSALKPDDTATTASDMASVDLSAVPQKFVVFDLETTGLDAARHEIIEIGAIRVNRDSNLHDTFQALVKPMKRIPKRITQINGISQQMVDREGEPLEAVLRDFVEFIEDLPLVSFNADFDMAFLRHAAQRNNLVIRNRVSCALKMARRAWPGRQSYRLCDLAKDGGLSDEDTHRALGDCTRALIVYTSAASQLGMGSAPEFRV
jgi:DNA polymerase-3 subunit epsilon/DNA polymerase-3 subunit alpha (Gram-positive type)